MFKFKRFRALVIKEFQDLPKNKNILIMYLMPLGFAILYSNLLIGNEDVGISKWYVLTMCVGMCLVTGCSLAGAMIIAEEKEKKTLRTMLLAGLKPMEFFFGKSVVCLILSTIVNFFIFFYLKVDVAYFPVYVVLVLVVSVIMIIIGAVIGMISPNQMSTGIIGLPIMIAFLLVPMFSEINDTMAAIAKFTPTYGMNNILKTLLVDEGILSISTHGFSLIVIVSWIVIGLAIFSIIYRKIGLEK